MQTTQSQALGEYFHAFRLNPHQPLTLLCIALGYMQQAMTRKVDDRNRVVLQAFAFFQVRLAVLASIATSVHSISNRSATGSTMQSWCCAASRPAVVPCLIYFHAAALPNLFPCSCHCFGRPIKQMSGLSEVAGWAPSIYLKHCTSHASLASWLGWALLQEYAQHREHEEESNYNLGRAAHHLGLVHIAVEYYKKCLDGNGSQIVQALHDAIEPTYEVGLKQEAAFNLSLIYRGTGADDLARQVLQKYVSIWAESAVHLMASVDFVALLWMLVHGWFQGQLASCYQAKHCMSSPLHLYSPGWHMSHPFLQSNYGWMY